ncbi:cell division/GTP binding protein [Pochonia chlamydosporia 170]|uniref:Cell division/GTP binding protein n=1 Tax=Pochonia chlamydosporia 170 TaxID=1380566 RepID=A0A179FSQ9_METCM|nr:cell division/GTP binding protein [Pochonia chlamydosporia 170]OAQ68240.2 cell division/GTP binding protein [Pochonia chlamydosporia 170]
MRPLPSTSSRNQHHDDSDTLSQQTPVASLDCFITTEAGIIGDYSGQRPMETRPTLQNHTQKQGVSPTMPAPCGHIPSSVGSSNAEHEKSSRPLTPVLSDNAGLFGPDSANSTPSSPGGLSSVAMSEDPHSLSASFSDLPLSHSPLPDISSSSPRAITPQLVMPSLTVPQRRPFSETGRSLGKLKILVTGRQGIGKTSLILAIAQSSTHIVHMDAMDTASTTQVKDVYASTRPVPWWRTDLDHGMARRRQSLTSDGVLDRNICFVDCPDREVDVQHHSPAVEYVESHLARLLNKPINDTDLGPTHHDLECMRHLEDSTNVIPLLARADELSTNGRLAAQTKILQDIQAAGLNCFSFSAPGDTRDSPHINAISSATRADYDTVDASILMSSDYLPPLVLTDLNDLIAKTLSMEGSTWLRHSAACKAIKWLRRQRRQGGLSYSPLGCGVMSSISGISHGQLTNRSHNRQHWDRIEMSSWAEGLRQSLATERSNQSWQHNSKTMSLTQRHLNVTKHRRGYPSASRTMAPASAMSHEDPLGLLQL